MELINTLENPGEFDALTSLRPDEPYFVLVGRDKSAPRLVREWARENRERALKEFPDAIGRTSDDADRRTLLERELRKSTEAEDIAEAMVEYKRGYVPIETKSDRYSGYEDTEEQAKLAKRDKQQADAIAALHNAIGECSDLLPLMTGKEIADAELGFVVGAMRDLAEHLTPARPGIGKVA